MTRQEEFKVAKLIGFRDGMVAAFKSSDDNAKHATATILHTMLQYHSPTELVRFLGEMDPTGKDTTVQALLQLLGVDGAGRNRATARSGRAIPPPLRGQHEGGAIPPHKEAH